DGRSVTNVCSSSSSASTGSVGADAGDGADTGDGTVDDDGGGGSHAVRGPDSVDGTPESGAPEPLRDDRGGRLRGPPRSPSSFCDNASTIVSSSSASSPKDTRDGAFFRGGGEGSSARRSESWNSDAVWKRSSRIFDSALSTTRSSPGVMP